ncbi:hypothetical protein [Rhizobium leguminosarum]|uniref:Uncharacterized protein n=1 Tax=Rhizobium leguminosarum TaxID=384 RepID=A0A7K3VJV5_RHILE|nr:hypothetical protein [Rhizobium leguminosarum]NEK17483.1 hypothetical protein [Rhizobium leguminosarum]
MLSAFIIKRAHLALSEVTDGCFNLISESAETVSTHFSIIAGQNGSGKSRILAGIANFLSQKTFKEMYLATLQAQYFLKPASSIVLAGVIPQGVDLR